MVTIGDRLKYLRIDILRLSQEEMAGLMGAKARQTIADYETNKTIPNVIQLKQICDKYPTISFDWLVSGEGESPGDSRDRITTAIKNMKAGTVQDPQAPYNGLITISVSLPELNIIEKMRQLPEAGPMIDSILTSWLTINNTLQSINSSIKVKITDTLQK